MKTPPNDANAVMRRLLRDTELGTVCTAGLLARAGAWSRGPACGDATVQARMRTALKSGAPCPAPGSHPSAKADGTCSALRGTLAGALRSFWACPSQPIVRTIGCDVRAQTASQIASRSSRVLHEISGQRWICCRARLLPAGMCRRAQRRAPLMAPSVGCACPCLVPYSRFGGKRPPHSCEGKRR